MVNRRERFGIYHFFTIGFFQPQYDPVFKSYNPNLRLNRLFGESGTK